MKTFTKILALLIALMMVVSMFAACADKADKNGDKNPTAGDTNPPDDGGTTNPPDDGGTTNPPDDGGTTNPPDDGGTTNPPVDEDTSYVYNPNLSVLLTTYLDYGWGNDEMTLDFTDSKIVRVKVAELDKAVADALKDAGNAKFTDKVLKLAGADTFALPGFTAAQEAGLFTAGYTYTITVDYYAKAEGTMSIVALNADGEREIFASADCKAGVNVLTIDYVVKEGDTGIAFKTTGADAEIYLGKLVLELFTYGPTYSQLVAGYTFDWSKDITEDLGADYGTVMQIKEITDETAKAAILAAGKTENDYVVTAPAKGNWFALPMNQNYYQEGRKYNVEVTYYSATGGSGYGGFLVLDGTSSNHAIKGGMLNGKGEVKTSSCLWEATEKDHTAIWYAPPEDVYIIDVKLTLDTSYDPHFKREDIYKTTKDDLEGSYTFDFTVGNAPTDSKLWIKPADLPEAAKAVCTPENGFAGDILHISQYAFTFKPSIDGSLTTSTNYTFTARVYSANGKVGGFLLLPMNAIPNQVGNAANPKITAVEGAPAGIYDVSWEIFVAEEVVTAQFYSSPEEEMFIGSITVTAGEYVEPDPLPEETTTKFEGEDIAAHLTGANQPYGSLGVGEPIVVVDTPDAVKSAMGDKIGDKAVKIESGVNGTFWADYDHNFAVRGGKIKYIVTVEMYIEYLGQDSAILCLNGHTNSFPIVPALVEGVNTIEIEVATSQDIWNISFHQANMVAYIGDVTVELVHVEA